MKNNLFYFSYYFHFIRKVEYGSREYGSRTIRIFFALKEELLRMPLFVAAIACVCTNSVYRIYKIGKIS